MRKNNACRISALNNKPKSVDINFLALSRRITEKITLI